MAQKIKFVTDSASDIPRSLREELDILVLPFPIAMGAREYQDGAVSYTHLSHQKDAAAHIDAQAAADTVFIDMDVHDIPSFPG